MEMEVQNNHLMLKEKLEFYCILKEAFKIPCKNTSFIIISLLVSLPLFLSMFFFEIVFQSALIEASNILDPPYGYFYYNWPVPTYLQSRLTNSFSLKLALVCLLFLLPVFITEFFSVILIVTMTSKVQAEETLMPLKPKDGVIEIMKNARWKGPFITSLYAHALSTCTLLGLIWLVINYYIISRHTFYGYFFAVFYAAAIMALLKKYLEWSAEWNMAIVISILEGIYGTPALVLSAYFGRGSEQCGLLLMGVFFLWGAGLRLPCLYAGSRIVVVFQVSFFCIGNAMKWVVCLIYFFDCKSRILENKIDEEIEREVEDANAKATTATG